MSYCDRLMSVVRVRRQQKIASKEIYSETIGSVLTNFDRNDPYMALFKNCSLYKLVPVHCISRSQRLKIDFQDQAKNGRLRGHIFYKGLYRKIIKKSSSLKPQG